MTTQVNEDTVRRQLMLVFDPELGVNVVDLGLIYSIEIKDGHIAIRMTLTTPGCPLHDTIIGGVRRALEGKPGVAGVSVEVVWEPQWTPERMSDEAKRQLSGW
ncbi:metal-sulfur cluster assembly factor [Paenibacillus tyrfis]|uniref:FeS assembly SUF system protein n=1 Tax=Paenibacillus tyrfis TaxID=1501230 RepID=A0A081PAB7_9BACL|nr:iron-sulfur cluster assembly protein [Paenibacillus tyrfis]KEQ27640.1 FeS assembly SUF system protein [Paenibacillus tyrfis]